MNREKNVIAVGIDPGVNTGYAEWSRFGKKYRAIETLQIHQAIKRVEQLIEDYGKGNVVVIFEDARKRKWYGNSGREQLQGAGSIKRDCKIWEDFLTETGVEFYMIAPKNINTKTTADAFKRITGWSTMTSNHARDAAMLVFGI